MNVIKIGRNPDNDIVIAVDLVSRYHADLKLDDNGQFILTDHSANGTMVNGRMVSNSSCFLSPGTPVFFPGNRFLDWNQVQALMHEGSMGSNRQPEPVSSYSVSKTVINPGMGFGETLAYFFDHYADFNGRARRKEYWYMVLWNLIFMPVFPIWFLATFIPSLALMSRRLHDQGLSGLLILLGLIPIIGSIALLVFALMDSEPKTNEWGPSPKYSHR